MSSDSQHPTGAVRSSDAEHLDFCSMPMIGVMAVARTSHEGGEKYGRFNYMKGFSAHDLLNHAMRHQAMFLLGDRSEPHLEHAAWGLLAAIQSLALNPELSAPHLLGPGATIPPAMESLLNREAPIKAAQRRSGKFSESSHWATTDIPEVARIVSERIWSDSGDQYLYGCERAGVPVGSDEEEDILDASERPVSPEQLASDIKYSEMIAKNKMEYDLRTLAPNFMFEMESGISSVDHEEDMRNDSVSRYHVRPRNDDDVR